MYDQLLNDFLKKESTTKHKSKADSPNYELFQKMDITEELARNGNSYPDLIETHISMYALYSNSKVHDTTLELMLRLVYDLLFYNIYILAAHNQKIYSPYMTFVKKDMAETPWLMSNQTIADYFDKFYDTLYKFLDTVKPARISDIYLWIMRDTATDTYQNLYNYSIRSFISQPPYSIPLFNTPIAPSVQDDNEPKPEIICFPIDTSPQYSTEPDTMAYRPPEFSTTHNHSNNTIPTLSAFYILSPEKIFLKNKSKPVAIQSCCPNVKYESVNGKVVINCNDDLYELNTNTIKKLLSIKGKPNNILKKYINSLEKEIESICFNRQIKDDDSNRPFFKYLYPNKIQCCLNANNGTVSISSHNTTTAFIKPIILAHYSLNLFRNGYVPRILCNCLQVISNNNYSTINKFAKLFADCLLPYPISKKLYVINVKSDRNLEIIKCFINRILSYGNGEYDSVCVIDKNQTINDVCKNYKRLDELKYARIYAMFMERGKKPLDPQLSIYLSYLLKNTSNNSKNTIVNNIQLILFQKNDDISDIPSELVEYIDISNSELDERICMLSVEDCSWTRLYFSIYGLHLILDKQKSRHKFDLGCKLTAVPTPDNHKSIRQDLIKKITDRFISEYFISKQETEKRKAERAKRIKELKKQHGKSVSANSIITLELSQFPLYTTRTDLEKYIKKYLETQYKASFLEEKNITCKDIYNCIQKEYEYTGTNLEYTMTKMYHAFTGLSLKEPWIVTKSKMEATNVNNVEGSDTEPIEAPKTATFDAPIDENLLNFLTKLNNAVMF